MALNGKQEIALFVVFAFLFSVAGGFGTANFGFCQDEGQQQTQTYPEISLSMPQEYLNYTVTRIDGAFWAIIDGVYPMHMSPEITSLPMVYPTPPNTTNMHVKLDGKELIWGNYSDIDPSALHHTDIGDWQMIHCTVNPIAPDFLLEIHYEHPIEIINGSYTFLYDLNISPYLSPLNPTSTAHFNVQLPLNISEIEVLTTGFEGIWTQINYNKTSTPQGEIVKFDITSEYGKQLLGDIAFVLLDVSVPEFSTWNVLSSVTLAILIVLGYYLKRYTGKLSGEQVYCKKH
jgi:hypothetical protein